jgi:hypothetical protein
MQTYPNFAFSWLSTGMILVFCFFSTLSFSQTVDIVSPVTNATYKLPGLSTMQTAVEVQSAIIAAENTAKALSGDAAKERAITLSAQNDLNKAKTLNSDYLAALNNFSKNDVSPYTTDLNNYTASGTKFNELLTSYNKAALANNALPAKERKAATVAALNKQKAQIDAQSIKLSQWKIKLDAAKTKLDVKNVALQKQNQKQEAADLAAGNKIKASKDKLVKLLNELTSCERYTNSCRALLISKFSYSNTPDTGYFAKPVYRNAINDINAALKN